MPISEFDLNLTDQPKGDSIYVVGNEMDVFGGELTRKTGVYKI